MLISSPFDRLRRVLAQVLVQQFFARHVARPHERRIEREHDERLFAGRLDQPAHDPNGRLEILLGQPPRVRPVGRRRDRELRHPLFVLDFDEVHPGVAEELQVPVDRGPPFLVLRSEVQEERGRRITGRRLARGQLQHHLALVHRFRSFLDPSPYYTRTEVVRIVWPSPR